ncbi:MULTISPECIES: FeoB-associated Cys-rich membrane protein [unclassified Megasphaera]|uniref:FeoB-associated Cys-rich membrane protein n=1 Tax=unclassified Megasphaera TaxID=2626256 RepID=UPI00073E756F|nr:MULTISPECIES: FeoB-associated Cys-rich membrane protein [unclassified Megasphaera]KUH56870.1 hypothetical protein AT798_10745 [Megasphaera sp. DJF_B143]MCI5532756.1 FeoB-associated Cys-rich membrane protein [Caecibacter massiliensis]HAM04547.1 FeoB-associated Cys-rich membrane protein [Megasphaera sp.]
MSIATIIVALVVLAAAFYIGRHIRGLFKGTTSCCGSSGSCSGSCPSCCSHPEKTSWEKK